METIENVYKVQEICKKFTKAFLGDDIDIFMKMIAKDCVWNIMATSEEFIGIAKVKELADRSVAARNRTKEAHMEFTNKFAGEGQVCIEFIHHAVVLDQWPLCHSKPDSGAVVAINSCIVCQLNKTGMIFRVDEYFDLGQAYSAGTPRQLYS
jgi:hypothetical protein